VQCDPWHDQILDELSADHKSIVRNCETVPAVSVATRVWRFGAAC
jgi:hypothetical protein